MWGGVDFVESTIMRGARSYRRLVRSSKNLFVGFFFFLSRNVSRNDDFSTIFLGAIKKTQKNYYYNESIKRC